MATFKLRQKPRCVEVAPPYELIGGFLSMEATSPRVREEIFKGIRQVREGALTQYSGGWNAHEIVVRVDYVRVIEYGEYNGAEDLQCKMPLAEFEEIANAWNRHMRR